MATQKDASFSSIPVFSSSSEFRVNASHFSAEDLNSFVDTLETIAKLKREQRENEERRNRQIEETRLLLQTSFHLSQRSLNSLGCAPSPTSSLVNELHGVCINKYEPGMVSPQLLPPDEDETYFSDVSIRFQQTPRRTPSSPSSLEKKPRVLFPPSPKTLNSEKNGSDSDESGVYQLSSISPTTTPKEAKAKRTRKRLMSFEKPRRTIRLRLLDLLLRRQKKVAVNGENIKKATSALDVSVERSQHEVLKKKYSLAVRLLRKMKKECTTKEVRTENREELEILNKALGYMTL